MKFTSTLLAAASGSLAGSTFSRNRGGQYIRRRAIPSNPNSEAQGIARENLATAVSYWTNQLTDAQRQAWATYAQATPVIDALGQQITLSGQQMFVRSTTIRLIAGLVNIFDGPITSGLGPTPEWSTDPIVADDQSIAYDVLVTGAGVTGDLAIYMSRPVVASRTPAHETRRFAGVGGPPVASAFNSSETAPFAVTIGQRVRVTAIYCGDDGRCSAQAFRDVVVIAGS
jgi:hypothetical protein